MGYSLVGSVGAVSVGAVDTAVTPAWGTSENRVKGNLLVMWFAGFGTATLPTTPSGWTEGYEPGTSVSMGIIYKIAGGGDSAPTWAAVASTSFSMMLAEFTGNLGTATIDKDGVAAGTSATETATSSGVNKTLGELILCGGAAFYSAANTVTIADSLNNATVVDVNNGSTSLADHYSFGYGFGTSIAAADKNSWSTSTATNLTGAVAFVGSMVLPPTPADLVNNRVPMMRSTIW